LQRIGQPKGWPENGDALPVFPGRAAESCKVESR
jgi:hypothetical protein